MITICNANFYDNGYSDILKSDSFLKFCIDSQKRLSDEKNVSYKMFDFNDDIVIEAKKACQELLFNKNIEEMENNFNLNLHGLLVNKNIEEMENNLEPQKNDERLRLTVSVDTIKTYIMSKIQNLVFLDNDIFVYNSNIFLKSINCGNIAFNGTILDQIICSNLNNLDLYDKLFKFRIENKITNINFNDTKMLELAKKLFPTENKIYGAIHISKYKRKFKNLIVVNKIDDLKKIKTNTNSFVFLMDSSLSKLASKLKIKFIDYNLCDEYAKKQIKLYFGINN